MTGHRLPGIPPRPRLDQFLHPLGPMLPSSHLDECPDDSPDHIPQKPVSTDTEVPIGRVSSGGGFRNNTILLRPPIETHQGEIGGGIGLPESFSDGAEGSFVGAADFFEAGKIVRPQEISAGFVHGFEVESGVAALPGIGRHERVFFPMDEVGIGTLRRTESGVKIIVRRKDRMDRDSAGQDGI